MTEFLFTNDAVTSLATAILAGDTTLAVASGAGAYLPNPSSGQQFVLKITPATSPDGPPVEFVYCTARSGDSLTVVRGQEGTTAQSWPVGANLNLVLTNGALLNYPQLNQFGNFFDVVNEAGHQYLPNGLLMQWGVATMTNSSPDGTGAYGPTTVTVPITFANAFLSIQVTDSGGGAIAYGAQILTNSTFQCWYSAWGSPSVARWFAIGY